MAGRVVKGPSKNDTVHLVVRGTVCPTRVTRRLGPLVYVDALREGDLLLTPMAGQRIVMRYQDELSYWAQDAVVMEVMDPIPMMTVRLEGTPKEVEVRSAPRAPIGLPLEYGLVKSGSETLTTTTIDVSAHGLRFPCAFRPWIGLDLRMSIRLEGDPATVVGRVVRIGEETEMRGRPAWVTGVQFIAPSPSVRNRINDLVLRVLSHEGSRGRRGRRARATAPLS